MSHPHITYYMNKLSKGTSRKAALLISAALSLTLLVSVPLVLNQARKAEESLSSGLAPQILRFHVLANSNSKEDQDLKLEVKQLLIDTMYEDLDGRELSKDELISYVTEHKKSWNIPPNHLCVPKAMPIRPISGLNAAIFRPKSTVTSRSPAGTTMRSGFFWEADKETTGGASFIRRCVFPSLLSARFPTPQSRN